MRDGVLLVFVCDECGQENPFHLLDFLIEHWDKVKNGGTCSFKCKCRQPLLTVPIEKKSLYEDQDKADSETDENQGTSIGFVIEPALKQIK